MAPDIVEEPDYESDPEELKRSLATRRREASNDEEHTEIHRGNQRPEIDSDDDDEEEGLPIDGEVSYDEEEEEEDDDDMVEYIADNDKTRALGKNTDGRNGEDATEDSATDVVDGEEQKKKELEHFICTITDFRKWMPPQIDECVVVGGSGNPEMKENGDMTNMRR